MHVWFPEACSPVISDCPVNCDDTSDCSDLEGAFIVHDGGVALEAHAGELLFGSIAWNSEVHGATQGVVDSDKEVHQGSDDLRSSARLWSSCCAPLGR